MRMITALNEDTNLVQDLTTTGEGKLCVESCPRFTDLGLIVNGDPGGNGNQLAAGAYTTPFVFDDAQWVRLAVLFFKSNVSGVLYMARISPDGILAAETGIAGVTYSSADSIWRDCVYSSTNSLFVPGKSAQFRVKNNGAAVGNYWLSVQLMGL